MVVLYMAPEKQKTAAGRDARLRSADFSARRFHIGTAPSMRHPRWVAPRIGKRQIGRIATQ
jgi:hypothetical protein